jgi:hypothetical protein
MSSIGRDLKLCLVLPLSIAAGAGPLRAQPTDGPLAEQSEIVPLYVSTTRPRAMLTIGDGPPAPVVFDTGTDQNILDTNYAKRLGLKVVGNAQIIDGATGNSAQVPVAAVPQARLSTVSVDVDTAQLIDHRVPDEVGVFGPNSFKNRYVIIEAGLNRVRLVPKSSGYAPPGRGTPYRGGLPSFAIRVNGLPLQATLDSGSDSALILGGGLVGKVKLKSAPRVVGSSQSALGSVDVLGGEIDGVMQVGDLRVENPETTFEGTGNGANVGFPVLRKLTIVLDPARKLTWVLDPTGGPGPLNAFVGRFGARTIRIEAGKLVHQRDGRPSFQLEYLGGDLFEMSANGDRVQFFRKDGRVVKLELITADGQIVPADRTG